jgi:hypothetical protein
MRLALELWTLTIFYLFFKSTLSMALPPDLLLLSLVLHFFAWFLLAVPIILYLTWRNGG